MKILLSNDDGYDSVGLVVLEDKIKRVGDVITVAPLVEQSAKGHSFTMRDPLRAIRVAENKYAVNGTPADCVYLGLHQFAISAELVVSGINLGANLGNDIYYSGTVAAAREAAIQGKKGIAVSLLSGDGEDDYERAAEYAVRCIELLLKQEWRSGLYWNINIPAKSLKSDQIEVVVMPIGHRKYKPTVTERLDQRGREYYWIGGPPLTSQKSETDAYWCEQGKIVLTPLTLDCTHQEINNYKNGLEGLLL